MLRSRYVLIAGLLPALFTQPGLTAEDWDLCRFPSFNFTETDTVSSDETIVEAQSVVSEDSESIQLKGDVSITHANQKITADNILFNKLDETINATGEVRFADPNYRLRSSKVEIDNLNDRATFAEPEFELKGRHARGEAKKIEKLDQYRSRFTELTYTSCDPNDRDWHLRASRLEIDDESGRGSATHTTIFFQEVPFLYLPYFQFPIDDRRMSGILAPTIGYDETNGTSLIVPIYWNIAPNYDMTITPASSGCSSILKTVICLNPIGGNWIRRISMMKISTGHAGSKNGNIIRPLVMTSTQNYYWLKFRMKTFSTISRLLHPSTMTSCTWNAA